jgi:hypothetical protein
MRELEKKSYQFGISIACGESYSETLPSETAASRIGESPIGKPVHCRDMVKLLVYDCSGDRYV